MKRHIIILLILAALIVPIQSVFAAQKIGEGYARPTFSEIIQTFVMLKGMDINELKVADEYGRVIYCDLYQKNFGNDAVWNRTRSQIISRVLKKKDYFRVKYEIVSVFNLGRYDFKNQFFPVSSRTPMVNVGLIKLIGEEDHLDDCAGQRSSFPSIFSLQLNEPLTINGFSVSSDKVEKMIVRLEETGNAERQVYGRIRVNITDAEKIDFSPKNYVDKAILKGDVTSVDFFLDPELTKPIGGIRISHE